ncbi:protein-glutamine gamma-glutamyltransferase E-like [Rhinatrema bivittatum]|uniref:protein-glutamine gamma-glutamyltransferase E-like n=1 Tax=Rhinatrema bivittatum TaxID=194408 RepID=UPI00112BFEE7|nr:protein-glutamine gamma-glutamyltransferase E-like [Rhinatrema bivittatum]
MAALTVTSVNLELASNKKAHHTDYYDSSDLILRRGQPFKFTLQCNRPMQSGDRITIIAQTGPKPSQATNTQIVVNVSTSGSTENSWGAVLQSSDSSTLNISMSSPANAIIGVYKLSSQIASNGKNSTKVIGNVTMLFNAWVKEDDVYMSNANERDEYVLNETGLVYVGSANSFGSRGWDYAQFEAGVLTTTLKMLNSNLQYRRDPAADVAKRNDPKYVCRVLSAMVNANDDSGVVLGRWDGDYSDGVGPSTWNGSVAILKKWNSSGPVKYGQCWVFAGVLCTVLRTLGIPTRMITNFESAHDTDGNLIVDQYYNPDKKTWEGSDSVWNFHVWNECWFTRPDLGAKYNGWQVVDATPQEPSGGIYRLGPASLFAIKEGDVDLDYDGTFVYAETNADKAQWLVYDDGTSKKIYSDTKSVGQKTSTKAVGSFSRVDVTNNYKYPEGSPEERQRYQKAREKLTGGEMGFSAMSLARQEPAPKPTFSGKFDTIGPLEVGKDIEFTLTLKNDVSDTKNIKITLNVYSIIYTNAIVNEIMNSIQSVSLGPNEEKQIPVLVPYVQYDKALTEDNMIKISAICEDDKEGRLLVEKTLVLKVPPVVITLTGQPVEGKPLTVDIMFSNPLNEDVTDCKLVVEGSGLLKDQFIINAPSLKPNQRSTIQFNIIPSRHGTRMLLASLLSDKFKSVNGSQVTQVAPSN